MFFPSSALLLGAYCTFLLLRGDPETPEVPRTRLDLTHMKRELVSVAACLLSSGRTQAFLASRSIRFAQRPGDGTSSERCTYADWPLCTRIFGERLDRHFFWTLLTPYPWDQ